MLALSRRRAVRSAASSLFDSVTTVSDPLPPGPTPGPRGAVLSVATEADNESLTSLIESAGASLVSLNVLHACLQPLCAASHSAWALAAASHCSSLRELSVIVGASSRHQLYENHPLSSMIFDEPEGDVHSALLSLFAARGCGLESLTLCGPSVPVQVAEAVSVYCRRLRRLCLEVGEWDVGEWDALTETPLLRCVGEGLTDLAIIAPQSSASIPALKAVKQVCAKLQRCEVRFKYDRWSFSGECVSELIGSIANRNGENLRMLALSAGLATVPMLETIADSF